MDGEGLQRLARLEQRVADINERGSQGLSRVEARVIQHTQQIADMDAKIGSVVPLTTSVIVLGEQVKALRDDIAELRAAWGEERRTEREHAQRWKALSYTIAAMLVCALIGAATVILSGALQ